MNDYYKILQVEKTATQDEIKKSFRELAKKFHPDASPDNPKVEAVFKEINEAYSVLSDESKKESYDRRMFGAGTNDYENYNSSKTVKNNASYRPQPNISAQSFASSSAIFENFFGFQPKSDSQDIKRNNDKVKPMKTSEAFDAIFGKRKF